MERLVNPISLGQTIKKLRLSLQLTQKEVVDDFMNVRTLQKIENGEVLPSLEVILHISERLQIDLSDLIIASRVPYYINHKLGSLFDIISSSNSNDQDLKNSLSSFQTNTHVSSFDFNLVYSLFNTFFIDKKDQAKEVFLNNINKIDFSKIPTDMELFIVSGYIALETDNKKANEVIKKFINNSVFLYFPTITYALNQRYLINQEYRLVIELSDNALNNIDMEKSVSIIPFIYGQLGVATYFTNKETKYIEKGLELLRILRKKDEYLLLRKWINKYIPTLTITDY